MADLEGVRRTLEQQRLEAERQHQLQLEQERLRLEQEKKRQEEVNLFRRQVKDVTPMPDANRKLHQLEKPVPIPGKRPLNQEPPSQADISDEMDVERFLEADDRQSYRRNGVGLEALKKLRKGQWRIQAQIDLHGLTSDEARTAVVEFLDASMKHDLRCVRIIHGKGLGSQGNGPVLKEKVKRWLVQKEEVLAFCQAPPRDGGDGALLVMLKAKQQ